MPANLTGTTNITATQDTLYEGNETVVVDITSVTNAEESGTQQVSTTITDDDSQPTRDAQPQQRHHRRGGRRVHPDGHPVQRLDPERDGQSGLYRHGHRRGTDYTAASSIIVTAGNLTGTTNITATQDIRYEGNETIIVDITERDQRHRERHAAGHGHHHRR